LVIGVPPNVGTGEGGQIILQASNIGTWTSASMFDNYQNKLRILRGNNTASDAEHLNLDMHTGQFKFNKYLNTTSFPGTATANLAVDSSGNIITVSTSGGTVFPYVGTAAITGSLTVTGSANFTGSVNATNGGFTGSLFGTSSWAQTASYVTSSNVFGPNGFNSVLTSSYSITA
jgi:hypothetical protein